MPGIAPWPVAWTPAVRPNAPAKRTAPATSSAVRASTTAAGSTGTATFHGATSGPYAGSSGACTEPVSTTSRTSKGASRVVISATAVSRVKLTGVLQVRGDVRVTSGRTVARGT